MYVLVNKLKSFFGNYNIPDITVEPFKYHCHSEDINSLSEEAKKLNVDGEAVKTTPKNQKRSISTKVCEKLQENCHSFVISGTEIDFFLPPSSLTRPVSHKMVAVQTYTEAVTPSKVQTDLDSVLEALITEICSCVKDLRRDSSCQDVSQGNSSTDSASVVSETIQLKNGIQTRFQDVRNAAGAGIDCECGKQDVQEKCIFCQLEIHYLGHDISPQVCTNDLIETITQTKLYHKERLLLSCGVLDVNKCPKVCCGWMMVVNVDNLAMALCDIPDIRLLWSMDQRFQEQFSGSEVRLLVN